MAYDLVQHMKVERDPLRASVLNTLIMRSNMMEEIPWSTIGTFETKVSRWKSIPTPAFRKINGAFSTGNGTFEQLGESVYPLGIDIDVDYMYDQDQNALADPRGTQSEMAVTGVAYQFNDSVINGDQAADPDSFNGLKKRVANLPAAQTISAGTNGLDVNASDANRHRFLDLLDQLQYALEFQVDVIVGNANSFLNLQSVLRRLGLLDTTRDQFGRIIYRLGPEGPRIIDIGQKADQTTDIITQTETQGSSSDCTSLYGLRFGEATYLHGIEMYPLRTKDLGERETQPTLRTRIEWPLGLALWNPRSITRLLGVRWL